MSNSESIQTKLTPWKGLSEKKRSLQEVDPKDVLRGAARNFLQRRDPGSMAVVLSQVMDRRQLKELVQTLKNFY